MAVFLLHFSLLFFTVIPSSCGLNFDGQSLLALAKNLKLPPSVNSTWNSSDPTPCKWSGVHCDQLHNVVSLNLSESGISGSLGPEIGLMKNLQRIDLAFNNISSSIPPELGNCSLLRYLDLSTNFLTGKLPETLKNLNRLSYLSLYSNSLSGKIPDSLFQIRYLDSVFLNQNDLTGPIPSNIGNLTRLTSFYLSENQLSGVLPDTIGNCTRLEELYLDHNQFVGPLPETLNNVKGLSFMDASSNFLAGKIPLVSGSCHDLQELYLSNNEFEGSIPPGLGNCSSLTKLSMIHNRLSGRIPSTIGMLTELSILYLSENSLTGSIPTEIGNCRSLNDLQLYQNRLEGVIPSELGKLTKLKNLQLFSNHLMGEVPIDIWRIQSLENVQIYNNSLSGTLPLEVTELKNLRNISLYDNRFSGVIPQNLGINSSLVQIDFTNNRFVGEIPPHICFGRKLVALILPYNLHQGSVPLDIGKCLTLTRLRLDHNNLTGSLPAFGKDSSLAYMDMSSNNLNGFIPPTLGNCVNLTMINWSSNKLFGQIPLEIGNLVNLHVLNLSHNHLYGHLPQQIARCSNLFTLDLGSNFLIGSIPSCLTNLTLLSRLILEENKFSGGIPDFFPQFKNLLELKLGGNAFGGVIPLSLGASQSLQIALNLSSIGLIGELPFQLGNLNGLQSLDLSLNNLTGSLTSLAALTSLIEVNVSYNRFAGPVPKKWMKLLNSTPSSFFGNPRLCVYCHDGDSSCITTSTIKTCSSTSRKSTGLNKIYVVVLILGSFLGCSMVCLVLGCVLLKVKRAEPVEKPSLHERSSFLLNRVMEATEGLNERYEVGRGAHGIVYKASLSPNELYAVKKLEFGVQKGSSMSMVREIQTVGTIRHRNLVKVVNFWLRKDCGLILYEFMEGGSLHDVLHEMKPTPDLEWKVRFRIALGTAQGLAYLHEDCDPAIVHRDIKPKNILLDAEMEPHISDFGIARLMDQISSTSPQSAAIAGTIGYISPESAFSTRKSKESDVYSYGVVVLELITRKKALDPSLPENTDLVSWVRSTIDCTDDLEAVIDPGLMDEIIASIELQEQVHGVLLLALRCAFKEASGRPSMRDVVRELTDIGLNAGSLLKEARSQSIKRSKLMLQGLATV